MFTFCQRFDAVMVSTSGPQGCENNLVIKTHKVKLKLKLSELQMDSVCSVDRFVQIQFEFYVSWLHDCYHPLRPLKKMQTSTTWTRCNVCLWNQCRVHYFPQKL